MAPITLADSLALQSQVRSSLAASLPDILAAQAPEIPSSPSKSSAHLLSRTLVERQSAQTTQPIVVPATYPGISPGANGGEIAGIVCGVVFGIVLLLWLISSVVNNRGTPVIETSSVTDNPGRYRRSRTNKTKSSRRTRSRSVVSRSEVSEAAPPPMRSVPRSPRRTRETVVIEETRREPSRPREVSRPRSRIVEDDDIIEVIEEHSPVRRPRRMSGYRNVDPDEYAGGGRPMRKVSRR